MMLDDNKSIQDIAETKRNSIAGSSRSPPASIAQLLKSEVSQKKPIHTFFIDGKETHRTDEEND